MTEPLRIRICFPGMNGATLFDAAARDNCTEPFIVLRERLRSLGFELECMDDDDVSGTHALWFWDVTGAVQRSGACVERPLLCAAAPSTHRRS